MKFDSIIFDIDNVLVDTRLSYTDCIRKTVQTYLETVLKFSPIRNAGNGPASLAGGRNRSLLSRQDIEQFKSLGGFNDDWDTCYGILLYLMSLPIKNRSINELQKQKNLSELINKIKTKPAGIKNVRAYCHTPLRTNDGTRATPVRLRISPSKIARIFQKFYLGEFIQNEKLLIPKSFLVQLKKSGRKIGIVTGRNRKEANLALRKFKIDLLFDAIVTIDETPKGRKKPDPYGLLKAADLLRKHCRSDWPVNPTYLYVGDLPDDMLTAERAKKKINIKSCGFLRAAISPKEMRKNLISAGADYTFDNVKKLEELLLN
jgi:phosphoglycolate phosphatase-like HAD superfamily hydrolase